MSPFTLKRILRAPGRQIIALLVGAFLAVIFVFFYDITRGHIGSAGKFLFYIFYPTHLLILRLIYLAVY